jgi:hypothetical protein
MSEIPPSHALPGLAADAKEKVLGDSLRRMLTAILPSKGIPL